MCRIIGIEHAIGNISCKYLHQLRNMSQLNGKLTDVFSSEAFSCQIDLVALHRKSFNEVFPESHELISNISLVLDYSSAYGIASGSRLVYPDHIGQVGPWIQIENGLISSRLPRDWSILLKESTKGWASGLFHQSKLNISHSSSISRTYTSVQPECYFFVCSRICWRKKPEPQLVFVTSICRNRKVPCIRLPHIEVHIRQTSAIDSKSYIIEFKFNIRSHITTTSVLSGKSLLFRLQWPGGILLVVFALRYL